MAGRPTVRVESKLRNVPFVNLLFGGTDGGSQLEGIGSC